MMNQEIIELDEDVSHSPFYSADMAPTKSAERNWQMKDFAVFWVSLSACIPTYMLASSMIQHGMDWKQAMLTILIGNTIVLAPILLNAHAGTKYGITFPIYCRSAFGILGANIPAMLRALVACGWFGIQTWIGGQAVYTLLGVLIPSILKTPDLSLLGINAGQMGCFLAFWLLNVFVVMRGINTIRWLLNIKAPLMVILGLALLTWAWFQAKGFGPMLAKPSDFIEGGSQAGQFWSVFFPHLTATVGFWATLSLNIPDFSRYAKSQSSQLLGQAIGLPASMVLFSFIGIAVTSATVVFLGHVEWDPIVVLGKFENPMVLIIAMIAICLATLATNIAANVVGPANDFVHLAPQRLSFRTAGLISCLLGILIQPWNLVRDPSGYIFHWLIAYSAILGAVGGILIADYYFLRRTKLSLPDLYRSNGQYWYLGGFNVCAMIALIAGIAPNLPGLLADLNPTIIVDPFWSNLYQYAWFVSFGVAMILYLILMLVSGAHRAKSR